MSKKETETVVVEKDDPRRMIRPSVTGKATEIFDWLEELFQLTPKDTAPGEPKTELDAMPERIALHSVYKHGVDRGPAICNKEWRPTSSPLPSREMLVKLANEFLSKAQAHCSTHGVKQKYCLYAYSNLKGAEAYQMHSFALVPGGKEYEKDQAVDDESEHVALMKQSLAHTQFAIDRMSEMLTSVTSLQNQMMLQVMTSNTAIISENRQLVAENRQMMTAVEEAKIKRQWEEAKAVLLQHALEALRPVVGATVAHLAKRFPSQQPQAQLTVGETAQNMQKLITELDQDQRDQIFGLFENGGQKQPGVLEAGQTVLLDEILRGQTEPSRLREFVASLTDEQKMKMAMVLKPEQLAKLIAIAESAGV